MDGELRLITPTDPEGRDSQSKSDLQSQYYQLTLGFPSLAADMCQLRPDPIQRTVFIDEGSSWCGNLLQVSLAVTSSDDADVRSAICGSKLPNGWGLFDVLGNLWEWCEDSKGGNRVLRGGGWFLDAAGSRTALRNSNAPTSRDAGSGLRLALSSPSGVSSPAEQGQGNEAEPAGAGTEGASAEQRP